MLIEALPRATALILKDSFRKIGSVGLPIPNVKVKISDEHNNDLMENDFGEIVI